MEYKDTTVVRSESCERVRIKEECLNQNEITESQTTHVQHIGTHFMTCAQISDVDTKVGVKQASWDANVQSSDIKSNPNQPSTCLGTETVIGDDEMDRKEERVIQNEVSPKSQKPQLPKNEIYFIACNESRDVETKVGIKQEACDPNGVSSDFKCDPEQPLSSDPAAYLGAGTLKAADEIDIKQELRWVEGTSADSLNEEGGSESKQHEPAEDDPLWESSRPYTDTEYSSSASQLQENQDTSSLYVKTITPPKQKYQCHMCEKSFKHLAFLKSHIVVHDDKRQYKCPICEKSFKHLRGFKSHLLVHDDKRPYKCQICEKSFKQLAILKKHLLIHDDKRPHKCQICEKGFKQLSNLKKHLLVHDDRRQYQCHLCDKSFKQIYVLKSHLLVHDDKRLFQCQICAKSFKRSPDLKSHLVIHDDKRQYKCQICEKSFKHLSILKSHVLVHDDKRQFKCQICEKSFKRVPDLKSHLLVHDDKRQYKCQICEKSFKRLPDMKTHLLLHNDTKQYKCQICEKSFKQLPGLKAHLLVHDHKKKLESSM